MQNEENRKAMAAAFLNSAFAFCVLNFRF